MSAASDFLEVELVKHIFRTGSFTKPTVLAVALYTAAPSDVAASGTEVTNANGYARVDVPPLDANWAATSGSDGLTDNVAAITFAAASGGNWGTITHWAIHSSVTHGAGDMYFHGALDSSVIINDGDTFEFAIGALNITVA